MRLSQHTYPGGGEGLLAATFATRNGTRVVIAPEGDVPAILAASVLARANLSQVLLSPPGGLPANVRAEVRRMNPAGAYIVGSTTALGPQVATDLAAAGVPTTGPAPGNENLIVRLGGSGAELSRQIAETLDRRTQAQRDANVPAFNAVALVNPASPDAVAVAGLAAARRLPILFTENGTVSPATNTTLANLDVDRALVIGGPQVVSDAAVSALRPGVQSERLGGADQYATSREVVRESIERGLPTNLMYVADGTRPIDGALLGSTVGRVTALMALSRPPLGSTAGALAAANNLTGRLDRFVLLQPAGQPDAPPPPTSVRVSKNFPMNSDTRAFRGKDAIALAVNPRNPNHVVAINNEYLVPNCEGTASFNGGSTWDDADELPVPTVPAGQLGYHRACNRIGDHLAESQKQTVAFGSGQNVYAAYATRRRTLAGGDQSQGIMVAKSTNGGRDWTSAAVAMAGGELENPGPYYELPTISVRPGATAGSDRVIVAAHETTTTGLSTRGDVAVSVSTNSGSTFTAPVAVENAGDPEENATDVSQPAIGPDGRVYLAWRSIGTPIPTGGTPPTRTNPEGRVKVARSDNGGLTWNAPVETAVVTNVSASAGSPNPPVPAVSSASTFPRIAVGPNGNVYLVYNQGEAAPAEPSGGFQGADHFIPYDSDVYFQRSLTRGARWSRPKLINDATPKPGNESPFNPAPEGLITQTRHPNVSVAPNGRVDIVWHDRRHWYRGCIHTHLRCEEARLGDTYLAQSSNNGSTFSPNHRVTDRSLNNDVGYDYRFGVHWTFGPVVAPQGSNQLLIGWMDTRNGSFDTDRQDIYLARVNMTAAVAPRPRPRPPAQPAAFPGCPVLTANVIRGTAASNTINGTTGADRIFAGTGNDVVDALAGNDCVDLGTGSDRGQGGLGNDLIVAGIGRDRVSGSSGNDRMRGNSGNDRLEGGRGNDRVFGDSGNDALLGSFGNDRLHGVSGKDRISGSRGRDRINGGSNNDRITGGSSDDRIAGGSGRDKINGNSGNDRIKGNSGNDRITSRDNHRDRVNCGSGRDRVLADRRDIVARNCERVRRR